MRRHCLGHNDIKEIILDLSVADCIGGPEQDRDGYPGYVLIFESSYIHSCLLYVKLRYCPPTEVVVISLHAAGEFDSRR